jgi:hypothetical protein
LYAFKVGTLGGGFSQGREGDAKLGAKNAVKVCGIVESGFNHGSGKRSSRLQAGQGRFRSELSPVRTDGAAIRLPKDIGGVGRVTSRAAGNFGD